MHVSLRSAPIRPADGFTIVEMMIAVAVAAVLLAIAVPNFTAAINANRLTSTANAMIGSLNAARMAAVQRNTEVQFCSNSATSNTTSVLGAACNANTANAAADIALSSATSTVTVLTPPSGLSVSSIQIHGDIQAISFNGLGQGLIPGTSTPFDSTSAGDVPVVDVCSTALSTSAQNHILVYMAAGSVITTSPGSGACP
jgi:type IV fimbrial biogenesis protein FimT